MVYVHVSAEIRLRYVKLMVGEGFYFFGRSPRAKKNDESRVHALLRNSFPTILRDGPEYW